MKAIASAKLVNNLMFILNEKDQIEGGREGGFEKEISYNWNGRHDFIATIQLYFSTFGDK